MRTTVELPPDLLRAAKSRAAQRGESLKQLFTRALAHELDRSARAPRSESVVWPLLASRQRQAVRITNDDLARADAHADVELARRATRRRR